MEKKQHIAFYIARNTDADWLIKQLLENGLGGISLPPGSPGRTEIFSNATLQHFIDEEVRHDNFEIKSGKNNRLSSSSSGEQRKALLLHIISKKPTCIIIDNVFESLDTIAREVVLETLQGLPAFTMIIQVFNRREDLLPFIKTIYSFEDGRVTGGKSRDLFMASLRAKGDYIFSKPIPLPLTRYQPINGPLVIMNNVSVHYNGSPVLKNIYWEINEGEFWQLTGPNGSGKSTLLSLITGDSPKGFGQELVLFGQRKGSGETVWDLKKKIGYFTPAMTMYFERQDSIEQMIIAGMFDSVGLYIKPSDSQVQLAREWLVLLGLYKDRNQPFRMFAAGHQRMILLARAMIKHPPLLILDEPTSGLDDEMASLFTALINKIAAGANTTILYVSHRDEKGLSHNKIFELTPTIEGSIGKQLI